MSTDLRKHGTRLMRVLADSLSEGITTGNDWPNTQDELTRLQSARLLREAAAEIEFLRGWAQSAFRVINNVIGPLMVQAESETGADQEFNDRLLEMAEAVAMQYPAVSGVEYTTACEDSREALERAGGGEAWLTGWSATAAGTPPPLWQSRSSVVSVLSPLSC